ncbi:MAG TPA: putative toxin-antitoxin system toxin component, PIN family [Terriglobia bacterium]|nr:putative toxin-antitoxin system toxin component, PIN family [Terriglobia bacterium]
MPKLKIVLDTNVIVSAHMREAGYESLVFDLAISSLLDLHISPEIFREYNEVLRRPRLRIEGSEAERSLRLIWVRATIVMPKSALDTASDLDDNKFLECAEEARADYLVTGNGSHFPRQWKTTRIANARELLELMTPDLKR